MSAATKPIDTLDARTRNIIANVGARVLARLNPAAHAHPGVPRI